MNAENANHHLLVVDDEASLRTVLGALLRRLGYRVTTVEDGAAALRALFQEPFSLVLTDLRMPGLDGLGLLAAVNRDWPDVPVIVLTAHGTVDTAVEALKLGAFDFMAKGCDNDEVADVVAKAIATRTSYGASPHTVGLAEEGTAAGRFGLIGGSAAMNTVFNIIEKVAQTPSTVLLTGESGTGKELVARALHSHSLRVEQPFIRVNCAAIPDTLIESELFGYEKGAFTGAVNSKPGRFELADKGTLFLDEIGEISAEMQVKLLRAIQESEFERVGGIKTHRVDVRLIAATNRDLGEEVRAGRFREDLFYRLNVVPIRLPPLRERRDDIPLLVAHLLTKYVEKLGQSIRTVAPSAESALCRYPWPGNIRELENVLERTLLFADSPIIQLADLPDEVQAERSMSTDEFIRLPPEGGDLKKTVRDMTRRLETQMVERALEHTGGNVTQAARNLGISRKSLQTKMRMFGLREEE